MKEEEHKEYFWLLLINIKSSSGKKQRRFFFFFGYIFKSLFRLLNFYFFKINTKYNNKNYIYKYLLERKNKNL